MNRQHSSVTGLSRLRRGAVALVALALSTSLLVAVTSSPASAGHNTGPLTATINVEEGDGSAVVSFSDAIDPETATEDRTLGLLYTLNGDSLRRSDVISVLDLSQRGGSRSVLAIDLPGDTTFQAGDVFRIAPGRIAALDNPDHLFAGISFTVPPKPDFRRPKLSIQATEGSWAIRFRVTEDNLQNRNPGANDFDLRHLLFNGRPITSTYSGAIKRSNVNPSDQTFVVCLFGELLSQASDRNAQGFCEAEPGEDANGNLETGQPLMRGDVITVATGAFADQSGNTSRELSVRVEASPTVPRAAKVTVGEVFPLSLDVLDLVDTLDQTDPDAPVSLPPLTLDEITTRDVGGNFINASWVWAIYDVTPLDEETLAADPEAEPAATIAADGIIMDITARPGGIAASTAGNGWSVVWSQQGDASDEAEPRVTVDTNNRTVSVGFSPSHTLPDVLAALRANPTFDATFALYSDYEDSAVALGGLLGEGSTLAVAELEENQEERDRPSAEPSVLEGGLAGVRLTVTFNDTVAILSIRPDFIDSFADIAPNIFYLNQHNGSGLANANAENPNFPVANNWLQVGLTRLSANAEYTWILYSDNSDELPRAGDTLFLPEGIVFSYGRVVNPAQTIALTPAAVD